MSARDFGETGTYERERYNQDECLGLDCEGEHEWVRVAPGRVWPRHITSYDRMRRACRDSIEANGGRC